MTRGYGISPVLCPRDLEVCLLLFVPVVLELSPECLSCEVKSFFLPSVAFSSIFGTLLLTPSQVRETKVSIAKLL